MERENISKISLIYNIFKIIFLYLISIIITYKIWNKYIIIFVFLWMGLEITSAQINNNYLKINNDLNERITPWKLLFKFWLKISVFIYYIWFLLYLIKSWSSWLCIILMFITIGFLKDSIIQTTKYFNNKLINTLINFIS